VVIVYTEYIYCSRYGRQPSASRKRPALQCLPYPASGIFNRFQYITALKITQSTHLSLIFSILGLEKDNFFFFTVFVYYNSEGEDFRLKKIITLLFYDKTV